MSAYEIFSQLQTSRFSKPFRVDVGRALVISSFNFATPVTNEVGDVVRKGDCAVLHKIEVDGDKIPTVDCGCVCILENLDSWVVRSEPVVQCDCSWVLDYTNNLAVLSMPGYYMFELCNAESIGSVSIKVEEVSVADAVLFPKNLFYGS